MIPLTDGTTFLRILSVFSAVCAGCSGGDDPATVALIRAHAAPVEIVSMKEGTGERITSLSLSTGDALQVLPHLDQLKRLTTLTISYPEFSDKDLKQIPPLPKLQKLRIGYTRVTDAGLPHIAPMQKLKHLDLSSTDVRGPGFAHLTELSQLEELYMDNSLLDDSAMPFITKNFRRLRRFNFVDTKVTEEGFLQLAELPWLVGIGAPNELGGSKEDPQRRQRRRELMDKYLDLYDEAKKKARAAGEKVPPDHIAPFPR